MKRRRRLLADVRGLRFIFVIGSFQIGGSERQAIMLARMLKEGGAMVQVWAFDQPGPGSDLCGSYGIPWRVVPLGWRGGWSGRLRELLRLAKALRRARPDVVFSYNMLSNVACGLTWRFSGARIWVWTQRSSKNLWSAGRRIERFAIGRGCVLISNSEGGADLLVRDFGVDRTRVHVVPNGVALPAAQFSRDEWRARLGIGPECLAACMIANLHRPKDHSTLLQAWRVVMDRLRTADRDGVLLLAGRLDSAEALRELCRTLSIEDSVRFLGFTEDVAGLLSACDMGVHSSLSEGCPNAVLECMSAGLPVAGTDIPAIRSVVGPEGLGFLAPAGDTEALADRILKLALDPELRYKVGINNRVRAASEYSPEKMYEHTLSILSEAWPGLTLCRRQAE